MRDNARADFALAAKEARKRGETLPAFDPLAVDTSHVLPGGTFIVGFSFAACSDMAQVRAGKIMGCLQADAAKIKFGGNLFRITGFDAARHIVPLLSVWSARNESTAMWNHVGRETVALYGTEVNNRKMGCITDRDKGLASGFFDALDLVGEIKCHTHLKVDVGKYCGSAAVKPFVQMAYAPKIDQLNRLKALAPPKFLLYLASLDESNWAKAHHKTCMHGRMSSSVTSSFSLLVFLWIHNNPFFFLPFQCLPQCFYRE